MRCKKCGFKNAMLLGQRRLFGQATTSSRMWRHNQKTAVDAATQQQRGLASCCCASSATALRTRVSLHAVTKFGDMLRSCKRHHGFPPEHGCNCGKVPSAERVNTNKKIRMNSNQPHCAARQPEQQKRKHTPALARAGAPQGRAGWAQPGPAPGRTEPHRVAEPTPPELSCWRPARPHTQQLWHHHVADCRSPASCVSLEPCLEQQNSITLHHGVLNATARTATGKETQVPRGS